MGISGVPIYLLSQGLLLNGGSLLQLGALYKAGKGKKGKQQIEAAQREADGADYGLFGEQVYGLPGWLGSNTTWIIRLGLNILVTGWLFRGLHYMGIIYMTSLGIMTLA